MNSPLLQGEAESSSNKSEPLEPFFVTLEPLSTLKVKLLNILKRLVVLKSRPNSFRKSVKMENRIIWLGREMGP